MRRIDLLITQVRRSTENEEFTADSGISDEEILQYFNDAQDEIQNIIQSMFPDLFMKEQTIQAVVNTEAYDIPDDSLLGNRISMLEYSPSGLGRDFYPIKKGHKRERLNGDSGNPSFYIRRNNQILVEPKPQQGGVLRLFYQKQLPKLDIRRGQVLSVVLTGSQITSLVLDTTQLIDDMALLEDNYDTVVDKDGIVHMRRIPVTAVSAGSGVVTVSPSFTFQSGETITAGDWILRGRESTTNSGLPDICEKYLLEYACTRLLMRDSSVDSAELSALLSKVEQTIKTALGEPDGDIDLIPVIDTQFLGDESWG